MLLDDLTHKRFGALRVIRREPNGRDGSARWLCVCQCGSTRTINGTALRAGRNKSCGCLSPKFKPNDPRNKGYSHLREYRIWSGMKKRCSSKTGKKDHLYFEKGIRVCEHWSVFENFLKDMGKCPDGMTIDRRDGNKGYSKDNCRWATPKEQANNTASNHILLSEGKAQTISQWAEAKGIHSNTLVYRIRRGWAVDDALNRPIQKRTYTNG